MSGASSPDWPFAADSLLDGPDEQGSDHPEEAPADLALQETNSVNGCDADSGPRESEVAQRVAEFALEYPELAEMPLATTHGRKLRRVVTEAEWSETYVDPDQPGESAFMVTDLDRRDAATWADGLSAFLTAHEEYRGLMVRFKSPESGETFEISLSDAWGESYHDKQYARAKALERQMGGGERPSGGSATAAWDDPATAMVTLSASSKPDGDRLPPIEHLDALHDSFSYDGVRDSLRNTMEYHLGLDSGEWGYWLQAEPHGLGDNPGLNACYTHLHVAVYFDAGDLDLDRVGPELERVIEKHIDVCDPAGIGGHNYGSVEDYRDPDEDTCISVNGEVENLGMYLASYLGAGHSEELVERPIEYLAWGALYWCAARRRTTRSQTVNQAIRADRCHQRAESSKAEQSADHGADVEWSDHHGPDVVCSRCGSGWAIDQTRLDEPPSDADLRDLDDSDDLDGPNDLESRWSSANEAAEAGESPRRARVRSQIEDWVSAHPHRNPSASQLLGILDLPPDDESLVAGIIQGDDMSPESDSFQRLPLQEEWELDAIIDHDGEEHRASGGGVDMVPLHRPEERLLSETRLRHGTAKGRKYRCGRCDVCLTPSKMSHHLAIEHGIEDAEIADQVLTVQQVREDRDLADEVCPS